MGGGGHEGPHHNFVVIAPMIMKFGTGVKLDVFYTMVTNKFVTSLLLRQSPPCQIGLMEHSMNNKLFFIKFELFSI